VITFLTLPLLVLTLMLLGPALGWGDLIPRLREARFVGPFYQSITALTFGLSGLRSLDRYVETRQNGISNGKKQ
jgi:hypothetical protein